jgi:hypothetical protein
MFGSRGRGDIITLLRDRGADPTIKNNHGVSALSLSHTMSNCDVRRFFADLRVSDT